MPAGHLPFAVLNATGNRVVSAVLRSRGHRVLSGRLVLITITGRRSGTPHTLPVIYRQDGEVLTIRVGAPARKAWWRNLRGGAPVELWLRGARRTGRAEVRGDEASGVSVALRLDPLRAAPPARPAR